MTTSWRSAPLPPGWTATQRRILVRDRGICYVCDKPGATEVDHKQPASRGGDDSDGNLGAIHTSCHRAKTARERTGGSRRRAPERHPGDIGGQRG